MTTPPVRELTPQDYGSFFWSYAHVVFGSLDWSSLPGPFVAEYFRRTIQTWDKFLEEGEHNFGHGCTECRMHFRDFLRRYPIDNVRSRKHASLWVWLAHNNANHHTGAPRLSYEEAAEKFGMVPLSEMAQELITKDLSA